MAVALKIRQVVNQIIEQFAPDKVILFGSHAYGKPTEDSDADLLVIIDTDERPISLAAKISANIDHLVPIDIVVKTPAEVTMRLQSGDSFLTKLLAEGIILHETRNKRVG